MKNLMREKALKVGTVIQGNRFSYQVMEVMRSDGYGYTYLTEITIGEGEHQRQKKMVVREHMMPRCSSRDDDGVTVVTPEDIAPTVESCRLSFIKASKERERLAEGCPWLINVIENFAANGTYYYVIEYLNGKTLVEYVEEHGGHLTYDESRVVLSPIFDAIRRLHSNHVLHTDVNPWHIRIIQTKNGPNPVLFSLYCTLHFSDTGLQKAWSLPVMNCEEGYAPPEQYGHLDHFTPQTDVYAAAATLVYALTGKHLPDSRTLTEQDVRDILPPTYPETLLQAFINALNPDVSQRTTSISQFRNELLKFTREMYVPVRRAKDVEEDDDETDNRHVGFFENVSMTIKSLFRTK